KNFIQTVFAFFSEVFWLHVPFKMKWTQSKPGGGELLFFSFFLIFLLRTFGVSAGKRDQIDKKFFFEIINVLDQMIKSTSILLKNFFLKKISIWSLFPALTPFGPFAVERYETLKKIKMN